MKQLLHQTLATLCLLMMSTGALWADDFTVERAVNLGQLDSWANMSQFQWQEIDHGIQDNRDEMEALKTLFYDPAPKDTVGFYNQIYKARDNQYIVLRLDKAKGMRPFYVRVTAIRSTTNPSQNSSKLYTAEKYAYIMPPIGETQLEVKIWPQDGGEEKAKTFTFYGHSYGSASVRTVMLDKSRIVPGDYDLQLIRYNEDTKESDTTYIEHMQIDKLYSFYTYTTGNLVEAYIRTPSTNGYKRIKLNHEDWAWDAVTHVNDNSTTVMTGPKMPFRQHKRLDAPNPTYIDTRLFSHHDTLWVNLYLDNIPSNDAEGLTMHPILADYDNYPISDQLMTWGKDPVSGRLYILTDGEPCTIECYRDGYLPKLTMYPGSYDHTTGIIEGNREEADIFLESIPAPVTSPKVTTAVLSSMIPATDFRGRFFVTDIDEEDILPTPLTEEVYYDEYASHKDTLKIAKGMLLNSYARLKTAIVAPYSYGTVGDVTLKKVHNAEANAILKETLSGNTKGIYSSLWDYTYWTTDFDLRNYIPANNETGRPAVAFDGTIVRELPILCNKYLDIKGMEEEMKETTERLVKNDKEGDDESSQWIKNVDPAGSFGFSGTFPLAPPLYFRVGFDLDVFRAKKISISGAFGAGIFYDVVNKSEKIHDNKKTMLLTSGPDDYGWSDPVNISSWANEAKESDESAVQKVLSPYFNLNVYLESFLKVSFPFKQFKSGTGFKQMTIPGVGLIDEVGARFGFEASAGINMDLIHMISTIVGGSADSETAKWLAGIYEDKTWKVIKDVFSPQVAVGAGATINGAVGLYTFYNTNGDTWFWKNHLWALKLNTQLWLAAQLKMKVNLFGIASAEAGINAGTGIALKYAVGSRMDTKNAFSGSAFSWYAGLEPYYRAKFLGWSKYGRVKLGRTKPQQRLIKPKNYKNPFHANFADYLSGKEEGASARRRAINTNRSLPGTFVTDFVDILHPVKYLAGGDSIIYQGAYENANDDCVEVASSGDPIYLSDWRLGGCSAYDAASIPGTDLVVLEQATGQIAENDLQDTLQLGSTVNRASRVYSIYYTKKHTGTKWYSPRPIYSSSETTSYRPRVALADNGTGVAIWQEGLIDKGSWVTEKDTAEVTDLVMNGQLMLSRYDGNETWTAPIPLMSVSQDCILRDYSVTYDGQKIFVVAQKVRRDADNETLCFTVDAAGKVTMHDIEQSDEVMKVRRVAGHNVLAWKTQDETKPNNTCIHVKSYGMDGKEDRGINSSLMLNNVSVEEFSITPDLDACSLEHVALLWRETTHTSDSTHVSIKASRLVPKSDGSFGLGSPITTVRVDGNNTVYNFDGYMTDEKIQVCYVAVDSLGNSQLNKTAAYFGNAFSYTVQFDTDNNQAFECDKDEVSLLVTVNNYGTSTINECVFTAGDKDYPLDMTIPAGASAKERVKIPYIIGSGLNTTMRVKYDDVLGIQQQSYARYMARRARRGVKGGRRRSAAELQEDGVYEQSTQTFFPYRPRFECFVAAQRVDENGDNHITICVRDYSRRRLKGKAASIAVGLKERPSDPILSKNPAENKYEIGNLFVDPNYKTDAVGCMNDYGSYRAGYVTLTVPAVTEKKDLYVGAVMSIYDSFLDSFFPVNSTGSWFNNGSCGVVTLYPSAETVAIENVYNNDDAAGRLHVSRQTGSLVVTGAEAGQQVRLYQANGTILARQQADRNGSVTFSTPTVSGVGLISSGKETVKFAY